MTRTIQTQFPSGGETCTAWLTIPQGEGPFPSVLLIHGATHEMVLPHYEKTFSEAGMAVVAFDESAPHPVRRGSASGFGTC
jgi:dipeptidyl aminopeptidase/acylaminoacyl peptidase